MEKEEQKRLIEKIEKNMTKGNTLTEKGFDRGLDFSIKLIKGEEQREDE